MDVLGDSAPQAKIFGILSHKIIDFIKKIDQNQVQIPQFFFGAFGAGSF